MPIIDMLLASLRIVYLILCAVALGRVLINRRWLEALGLALLAGYMMARLGAPYETIMQTPTGALANRLAFFGGSYALFAAIILRRCGRA